jgi:hypothetical protein
MKIEKLLTLSQFVDFLETIDVIPHCHELSDPLLADKKAYELISNYNDFLKQPLTKEMFVNSLERPMNLRSKTYAKDRRLFEEAEKKVIFSTPNEFENVDIIIIAAKTIGGYANAMNGELTLKNVTIDMKKKTYRKTIKTLVSLSDKLASDVVNLSMELMKMKKEQVGELDLVAAEIHKQYSTPSKAITPVVDKKQTERIIDLKKENEELKQANGELCIKLEKAEKKFQEAIKIKE